MRSNTGRVLYVVANWLPEEQLDEWNRWHNEVHVPDVVAQPRVRRARKYRVQEDNTPAEWHPQYITVYEFDSLEDYESYRDSDEAARLRKEHADRYGAAVKISRQVLVETGEFLPDEQK